MQWYEPLRAVLYSFHIAFLFYLSGYATGLSGSDRRSGGAYRLMVRRRGARLLLPALLFGLVILTGKLVAARFIMVDNLPASPWSGVIDLVWHTDRSPAQSVWYLVVLFIFVAATPPLRLALGDRGGFACALSLLGLAGLSLVSMPRLLYLHGVCGNAVFFAAGIAAASKDANWTPWLDSNRRALTCGLLVALAAMLFLDVAAPGGLPTSLRRLATSLIALPALHALMRGLPPRAEAGTRCARSLRLRDLPAQYDLHRPRQGRADARFALDHREFPALRDPADNRWNRRTCDRQAASHSSAAIARPHDRLIARPPVRIIAITGSQTMRDW